MYCLKLRQDQNNCLPLLIMPGLFDAENKIMFCLGFCYFIYSWFTDRD